MRGKGEIKYEGTLVEKFPALIRTQKKSKHNDFESLGLPWVLTVGKHCISKGKMQQCQQRQRNDKKQLSQS